ncbi:helix-turn-helix domain-containing protein [Kineosporia sp. J2-2]|uniref:Helix-turn-helix domain-containing protein n=1 Tax=Kineosporia corallincola TaxID=2835133 RepID=A0ABS5TC32_9ACTN|nr:helix-turn-helix transcriptional regulator [Kineosporia corallincola]MBT0768610.1 helix-turn-helix domain-containing protein [Kineosporia corallincola]
MSKTTVARAALRDFLISRRARVTPEQAGLATFGTTRRVNGLRREEVAMLAGISAEYYVRLERGNAAGVSAGVRRAVADVLRLDQVERDHFEHLLDALSGGSGAPAAAASASVMPAGVRAPVQLLIDAIADFPVFVFNRRLDIVGANRLGRLLYAPIFEFHGGAAGPANAPRFAFLAGAAAERFWPERAGLLGDAVADLRRELGRDPHDRALISLIDEFSRESAEFRALWAEHDVRRRSNGIKTLNHPVVGPLTMPYEKLLVAGEGLEVMAYTPDPAGPEYDALKRLSVWEPGTGVPRSDGGPTHEGAGN